MCWVCRVPRVLAAGLLFVGIWGICQSCWWTLGESIGVGLIKSVGARICFGLFSLTCLRGIEVAVTSSVFDDSDQARAECHA